MFHSCILPGRRSVVVLGAPGCPKGLTLAWPPVGCSPKTAAVVAAPLSRVHFCAALPRGQRQLLAPFYGFVRHTKDRGGLAGSMRENIHGRRPRSSGSDGC